VKCKHGSTTGQLDPQALFYLRSRGIAEAAARTLLTYAFASDVGPADPGGGRSEGGGGPPAVAVAGGVGDQGGIRMSAESAVRSATGFDVEAVRRDFPILGVSVHGKAPRLPRQRGQRAEAPGRVIDAERDLYERYYSNIHSGVTSSRCRATDALRGGARQWSGPSLGARESREVVFVRGTTPRASTWWPQTLGRKNLRAGDEVLISGLEHHSNIVPWQILCEQTGPCCASPTIDDAGEIDLLAYERLLGQRTKLVAVSPRLERPRHRQPRSSA